MLVAVLAQKFICLLLGLVFDSPFLDLLLSDDAFHVEKSCSEKPARAAAWVEDSQPKAFLRPICFEYHADREIADVSRRERGAVVAPTRYGNNLFISLALNVTSSLHERK